MSFRVGIRAGEVRDFLSIVEADDGSLYVAIVRSRAGRDQRRERRISYHTSGRVTAHGFGEDGSIFFEPLIDVTMRNPFAMISVPALRRLDVSTVDRQDVIIETDSWLDGRVTFALLVTSVADNLEGSRPLVRLGYSTCALVVCLTEVDCASEWKDHFIYARPLNRLFTRQRMGRLESELAFHQRDHGPEMIVYPPDAEGVYTLYPSVVMRTTPRINIAFLAAGYEAEAVPGSRPNRIRFRVKGRGGYVRSKDLRPLISSIELDAEL